MKTTESKSNKLISPYDTNKTNKKNTKLNSTPLLKQKISIFKDNSNITKIIFHHFIKRLKKGFIILKEKHNINFFGDSNSDLKVKIHIHDPRTYRRILLGGSIGAAETYIEGQWSTDNLTALIQIFCRNLPALEKQEKYFRWIKGAIYRLQHHVINRNNKSGSRTNIAAHYDLSNDLYRLILDLNMQYSSAIFPQPNATLEQAQEYKMHVLCERLKLTSDDHLLEIGTGWGGFACYAAQKYGCLVTTTTISKSQHEVALQRITKQGLQKKVNLLLNDYRDLTGKYTKIISVEMIEAVGHRFMPEYFKVLNNLLIPGGKLLLQAITVEDQRYDNYRKNVDFIQRYIFPGGHLPSVNEIIRHIKEQTNMRLNHFSDYGSHYSKTLKMWNEKFLSQRDGVLKLGFSKDFIRLWEYYFCYCEGAFRESVIGLAHIELIKSKHEQ